MAALGPTASSAQDPLIPQVIEKLEEADASGKNKQTALSDVLSDLDTFEAKNPGSLSETAKRIIAAVKDRTRGSVTTHEGAPEANFKALLAELKAMQQGGRRRRRGKKTAKKSHRRRITRRRR